MFLSISLDPKTDTPEVLRNYRDVRGIGEGWIHLTGDYDDIEDLRYALGVYDPDPVVDADITQHGALLTFGNEKTGVWNAIASLSKPELIHESFERITDPRRGGYPALTSSRTPDGAPGARLR